jgi:hypothetical protein
MAARGNRRGTGSWGVPPTPVVEVAHIQRRGVDTRPAQERLARGRGAETDEGGCHLGPTTLSISRLCGDTEVRWHLLSPSHLHSQVSLGFGPSCSNPSSAPNLEWVYHALGKRGRSKGWSGTLSGDCRYFAQVVRSKQAPVIMIPPRPARGWGRNGVGSGRGGRGDDRIDRQGYS